jgi:hypothetical protein
LTKAEHRRWLENIPEPAIGTNDAVIRVSYTGSARVKGVVLTTAKLVVFLRQFIDSSTGKFVAC